VLMFISVTCLAWAKLHSPTVWHVLIDNNVKNAVIVVEDKFDEMGDAFQKGKRPA